MFRILCFNVSWGAMSDANDKSSLNDKSNLFLVNYCKEKTENNNENICRNNIIKYILDTINDTKYHIILLQELKNYLELTNKLKKHNYSIIETKQGKINLVSYYRNDIYEKDEKIIIGNVNKYNDKGRLFHIFFLENKQSKVKYTIINIHNGHNNDKKFIKEKFLEFKNDIPDKFEHSNIIIGGDFNDHGNFDYWKGIEIFNKKLSTNNLKPPCTCCTGKTSLRNNNMESNYGDYILVDENLSVDFELPKINHLIYNGFIFPTSDHLPITGIIKTKRFYKYRMIKN